MEPLKIIEKYYKTDSKAYHILTTHGRQVAETALELAKRVEHLNPDPDFLKEAAMLHDIGIFLTDEPRIDCHGDKPYLCHGYLGRELVEKEGFPEHALVCERHVGVGITKENIERNNLPLPKRDMRPQTIEEKIICLADKFYSKKDLTSKKSIEEIKEEAAKHGLENLKQAQELMDIFNL